MSSSEASTSDSGIEASAQALSLRGGKRKVPFEPPQGAVLVGGPEDDAGAVEKGEFDWESIKDDKDVELWLVRIPNSIKPKHLNNAVFNAPSSSSSTHTLGQVKRRHEIFDLWSLGDRDDNDVDRDQIGGDEMNGLSCLLPRKSKDGNLSLGPKAVTRRLVLAASSPLPDTESSVVLHQNPPRHSYPTERFKHRYTPYGTSTAASAPPVAYNPGPPMDVDQEGDTPTTTQKPKRRPKPTDVQKKTTKRYKSEKP